MTTTSKELEELRPAVKRISRTSLIVGAILLVIGVAALIVPNVIAIAMELWIGVLLLLAAIAIGVQACSTDSESRTWDIAGSVMYGLAGLLMLLLPKTGVITIALLLGVLITLDGTLRLIASYQAKRASVRNTFLFEGVIAVLLGLIVFANWPGNAGWILGILLGIRWIMAGLVALSIGYWLEPVLDQAKIEAKA